MFEDLKKIPELSSIKDNNNFYEASFNKEIILKLFQELKNNELFSFDQLIDITAIDYPSREKRFELVYILLSMKKNKRIIAFSKKNGVYLKDFRFHEDDILLFGREDTGLPNNIINASNSLISIFIIDLTEEKILLTVLIQILLSINQSRNFAPSDDE